MDDGLALARAVDRARWPPGGPPAGPRPPRAAVTAAWLDGTAARAMAATRSSPRWSPATSDPGMLDDLVRAVRGTGPPRPRRRPRRVAGRPQPGGMMGRRTRGTRRSPPGGAAEGDHRQGRDLLSGPGGLASFLRDPALRPAGRAEPAAGHRVQQTPSAGIRNAVILRDRRCRWPGGCHPARGRLPGASRHAPGARRRHQPHRLFLLCSYHHQIVIHRWGWTLVLNPDGTTTAWNPDRTKVLHSHGPPARAG